MRETSDAIYGQLTLTELRVSAEFGTSGKSSLNTKGRQEQQGRREINSRFILES